MRKTDHDYSEFAKYVGCPSIESRADVAAGMLVYKIVTGGTSCEEILQRLACKTTDARLRPGGNIFVLPVKMTKIMEGSMVVKMSKTANRCLHAEDFGHNLAVIKNIIKSTVLSYK